MLELRDIHYLNFLNLRGVKPFSGGRIIPPLTSLTSPKNMVPVPQCN